ncbi:MULTISPECIES: enoyl-CoA hydratase/isomerase family protein [Falsihalocynthiibacter]|uniref:enoyl-CoA hydratase/isomerase family protein n=1 Tax=Falsihalocynthiibacter TaxID=2854182 RepID=UPI0030037C19
MIDVSQLEGVWTVTLNRPQKANSLTREMLENLIGIVRQARDAKAVVFTGTGVVFSAGADLDEARAGLAESLLWEQLSGEIAALRGLTICALNGTIAGGAFGMALACDIRISVPEARFFYPVMKHGFLPQPSDPKRMATLIGPSRTKLVFLCGQKLTSEQAFSYGLVDQVVSREHLFTTVESLCADVISAKPEIAFAIKSTCPNGEKESSR